MVENRKMYLLDTNVIIQMLRGDSGIIRHIYEAGVSNCHISEITVAELYYGAVKGNRQSNFDDIEKIVSTFRIVYIYGTFEQLARIRLDLKNKGKIIDTYDMMIGATAVHHGYTLVTHNIKHYINIPRISLRDWQD